MATKRRKRRTRRSCKHGKLKRPVRTKKGGRRRCKKRSRKSRKSRKYRMSVSETFGINKWIYTDKVSDDEINYKTSKGHWAGGRDREYYMLRKIYYDYNPNYYKEGICNDSKQFYFDNGKTWYVDFQQVDFAGKVVNPKINSSELKSFLKYNVPINMDESGIVG